MTSDIRSMPHYCVLMRFFNKSLPCLKTEYRWQGRGYAETVQEKLVLTHNWKKATTPTERSAVARQVIVEWGGIKTISSGTLSRHAESTMTPSIHAPFSGIASYSKLLAIAYPERYAIYDSRVSACLNALQINAGLSAGVAFNYAPGRNNVIGNPISNRGFTQQHEFKVKTLKKNGWKRVTRDGTYSLYLRTLRCCLEDISGGYSLQDLEMALFANAEIECEKAMRRPERSPSTHGSKDRRLRNGAFSP